MIIHPIRKGSPPLTSIVGDTVFFLFHLLQQKFCLEAEPRVTRLESDFATANV